MRRLIERVWLDRRFTAIVVTDEVAEAVTLADRVLMIESRQITLNHRSIFSARADAAAEVAALEGRILRELFRDG
jgi:sulfonate transport system ATP-binding protein